VYPHHRTTKHNQLINENCADDPEFRDYTDISELPQHRLAEIRRFFEDYKKNENKVVVVDEFMGVEDARRIICESMGLYNDNFLPKKMR
jgi:inorganic pyrophosphatase